MNWKGRERWVGRYATKEDAHEGYKRALAELEQKDSANAEAVAVAVSSQPEASDATPGTPATQQDGQAEGGESWGVLALRCFNLSYQS